MIVRATTLVATLLLTAASVAAPNPDDDYRICQDGSGDTAIAACTRVIASGKYYGAAIGICHFKRGVAYFDRGDHNRAIADFNVAIKFIPSLGAAYYFRGLARRSKGDKAGAEADFATAGKLDPSL